MPTIQPKPVYVDNTQDIKTGKGLIGWDRDTQRLVVTTPVTNIEPCNGGVLVDTIEGGYYFASSNKPEKKK